MRIFGSPPRYYQGAGVFDRLGEIAAPFCPLGAQAGAQPLVVIDPVMLDVLGARLAASLHAAGLDAVVRPLRGEVTYPVIDALIASLDACVSSVMPSVTPSVVIGVGGGKALDAAKAVALKRGLPVITVPTAASNDSPTSASIAMYDDAHVMIAVDRLPQNPQAVVVDTAIIACAPVDFLRAGIGDAIAKKFEARGCRDGTGNTPWGTRPLLAAQAIADACYHTLRTHAVAALEAAGRKTVNDALEAVVEANVLMSGLGFENGGLSVAHSLTRGLVKMRGAKNAAHGYHVAYGVLVHLACAGSSNAELCDLAGFLRTIGLPCTLAQLGMENATQAEVQEIARWTMTAPHLANFPLPLTQASVAAAIARVESLSP